MLYIIALGSINLNMFYKFKKHDDIRFPWNDIYTKDEIVLSWHFLLHIDLWEP